MCEHVYRQQATSACPLYRAMHSPWVRDHPCVTFLFVRLRRVLTFTTVTHIYRHACTFVDTHVASHVCTHVYTHVDTHIHAHVYTNVYTRLKACLYRHVLWPTHRLEPCTRHFLGRERARRRRLQWRAARLRRVGSGLSAVG